MKTNALFNPAFFRRFNDTSQSINSSLMIFHPLKEGTYTADVYQNNKLLGDFAISCSANESNTQADIDLSKFINTQKGDCSCDKELKTNFTIKQDGYLVFFTSSGENGFHVDLKKGKDVIYSTKKLQKGDLLVSIILRPGLYEITGSGAKCTLSVDIPKELDDYQKYLSQSTNISLTAQGFSKNEITAYPGSGLVISLEAISNIDIKMIKPYDAPKSKKEIHRWTKPEKAKFSKNKAK
jgi:hypothetical protein